MNCNQQRIAFSFSLLLALAAAACVSIQNSSNDNDQAARAVRDVMEMQQAAWNRGDIESFMNGYERAETTTFVSGDQLTRGWQTVLERYKQRYSSREQMGMLNFSDLDVQPLGPSYVVADGRWQLTRATDAPHGRFTLVFRKTTEGWRIIHDTTTSATE